MSTDFKIVISNKRVMLLRHIMGSLWQRRLRSALGVLGMACGVVLFLMPVAVEEGAKRKTLGQIEQLGLTNITLKAAHLTAEQLRDARDAGSLGLAITDGEKLKQWVPGIEEVVALKEVSTTIYAETRGTVPQVLAVTAGFVRVHGLKLATGRFLAETDVQQNSNVCVIGHQVAVSLVEQGAQGQMLRLGSGLCHIVGIMSHFDKKSGGNAAIAMRDFDNAIFIPLENRSPGTLPIPVSELVLKLRTPHEVLPALPSIRRAMYLLHHGAEDFQMVVPQQLLKQADQARHTFDLVLWSISIMGFLIGGLGIMNIMLANVMERTREIGIRRAIGASRTDILLQFLAEALVLTVLGGLVGVAAAFMGIWVISAFADWDMVITLWVAVLAFVMPVFTGLFFGLYPAVRAAKMDPIIALGHE